MAHPILEARELEKVFEVKTGLLGRPERVRAVDGVSLRLERGRTLGLIGESGCGKSTLGKTLMGLYRPTAGQILLDGKAVHALSSRQWGALRRSVQIIFQDPYSSLDPRMTVFRSVSEPLRVHTRLRKAEQRARVEEVLHQVGLPRDSGDRYPHQFSGGQRQRIGFARALALNPSVVICDEPVSALDVSVQAQVLNTLTDAQRQRALTYLFISHDMGVIRHMSDRIAVMYLGAVVEAAEADALFRRPRHPYTIALFSAIPEARPRGRKNRIVLTGDVPSPTRIPPGCRFHTRCPHVMDVCRTVAPEPRFVGDDHMVSCHWEAPA